MNSSKNMTWILVPVTVVGIIISLSILTESKSSIVEREFEEFKEFDEYEDNMDKDDFYEDDYDEEYYDENGEIFKKRHTSTQYNQMNVSLDFKISIQKLLHFIIRL